MQYIGWASQVAVVVKNLPAIAGDVRDTGQIPKQGRFPGGGHGNPAQYSCLENPMNRGAWKTIVHRVAKSWTETTQQAHKVNSMEITICSKLKPYSQFLLLCLPSLSQDQPCDPLLLKEMQRKDVKSQIKVPRKFYLP